MKFLESSLLQKWLNKKQLKQTVVEQYRKRYQQSPFPHIEIREFFNETRLKEVLKALAKEEFMDKESDLFKFAQTNDLKGSKSKVLQDFRNILHSKEFTEYISYITGEKIREGKIDIAGNLYQNTDYLLCHDDLLEDRKIAYMVYLSTLKPKDGGELSLFITKNQRPYKVAKKITPRYNSLVLFTVSETSFHAVEEIIGDVQRITINGWFYD